MPDARPTPIAPLAPALEDGLVTRFDLDCLMAARRGAGAVAEFCRTEARTLFISDYQLSTVDADAEIADAIAVLREGGAVSEEDALRSLVLSLRAVHQARATEQVRHDVQQAAEAGDVR